MKRRNGNTTRIVDNAIQNLFTEGRALLVDHYRSREANEHVLEVFERRMAMEHLDAQFKVTPRQPYGYYIVLEKGPQAMLDGVAGFTLYNQDGPLYIYRKHDPLHIYSKPLGQGEWLQAEHYTNSGELRIVAADAKTPLARWPVKFHGKIESRKEFELIAKTVTQSCS